EVLSLRVAELESRLGPDSPEFMEYQSILTAVSHLPPCGDTAPPAVAQRQREKEVIKRRLATLVEQAPAVAAFIDENVARFNGEPGRRDSFDLLDQLLERQPYRLAFW